MLVLKLIHVSERVHWPSIKLYINRFTCTCAYIIQNVLQILKKWMAYKINRGTALCSVFFFERVWFWWHIQYIPRNMLAVFALLCFVVVIHWLIFPYPSGLLHWHCGNLAIALVPAKQPWWIWINPSCEFIMNDCITTTKQSTTKPCAYFLGYTVILSMQK